MSRDSLATVRRHAATVPCPLGRSYIEGVVTRFMSTYPVRDVDTRVSLFAEALAFEDPAGLRYANSNDELRGFFDATIERGYVIRFFPEKLVVCGNEAFQRANVALQLPGAHPDLLLLHLHFVFGDDGKIVQLRTFFDDACRRRAIPDPNAWSPAHSIVSHLDRAYIERTVNRFLSTYPNRDVASRIALFADELVFEDPAGLPFASTSDGLRAFFDECIVRGFVLHNFLDRLIVVGDEALALVDLVLQVGETDPVVLELIERFVFDPSGKIVEMKTYFDDGCIRPFVSPGAP